VYFLWQPLLTLNESAFTDWIKERIKCAKISSQNSYHFIVNEKYVCLTVFKTLFDISKYKFDVAESDLYSLTIHRNTGKKKSLEWTQYISKFFYHFDCNCL
jgi:hypothetical protein